MNESGRSELWFNSRVGISSAHVECRKRRERMSRYGSGPRLNTSRSNISETHISTYLAPSRRAPTLSGDPKALGQDTEHQLQQHGTTLKYGSRPRNQPRLARMRLPSP